MNVFEAVKQSVTARQAAEVYGIRVNRNGMCPIRIKNYNSRKITVTERSRDNIWR